MHYFDHNATAPLRAEARDAWMQAVDESWLNPSAPYLQASSVRVRLENAREQLAGRIGCQQQEVVFNSGATEGNNAVVRYLGRTCPPGRRILVSALEHPSVLEPARRLGRDVVQWIGTYPDGTVDLEHLQNELSCGDVHAVSVMAANNETGVLQPWREILESCRAAGVYYHCDAVQWIGKLACQDMGAVDFLTGCAHKFGGPKGCGFLKLPAGLDDFSMAHGGAQEGGYRAGTEDYPSIASMLAALEVASPLDGRLRDVFEAGVAGMIPDVEVIGSDAERLGNTSMLILPDYPNTRWVNRLARRGFLVSTGSACATAKEGPSHVLAAMGVPPELASRTVRVSSGPQTDTGQWESLAKAFGEVFSELQQDERSSGTITV